MHNHTWYVHNWEKLSALKSRGDIKNTFGVAVSHWLIVGKKCHFWLQIVFRRHWKIYINCPNIPSWGFNVLGIFHKHVSCFWWRPRNFTTVKKRQLLAKFSNKQKPELHRTSFTWEWPAGRDPISASLLLLRSVSNWTAIFAPLKKTNKQLLTRKRQVQFEYLRPNEAVNRLLIGRKQKKKLLNTTQYLLQETRNSIQTRTAFKISETTCVYRDIEIPERFWYKIPGKQILNH